MYLYGEKITNPIISYSRSWISQKSDGSISDTGSLIVATCSLCHLYIRDEFFKRNKWVTREMHSTRLEPFHLLLNRRLWAFKKSPIKQALKGVCQEICDLICIFEYFSDFAHSNLLETPRCASYRGVRLCGGHHTAESSYHERKELKCKKWGFTKNEILFTWSNISGKVSVHACPCVLQPSVHIFSLSLCGGRGLIDWGNRNQLREPKPGINSSSSS